jgi:hypothetical protein
MSPKKGIKLNSFDNHLKDKIKLNKLLLIQFYLFLLNY